MSQHDYNIANAPGATVRSDINSLAGAIATLNSGASAPAVTFANMLWYDTTFELLKQRNPANNGWITIASISGSAWKLAEAALNVPASGSWFGTTNRFPFLDTSGVLEIGPTLDFHPDAAGSEDYRLRIARATGANGAATITNDGTGGLNIVPGAGGFKVDGNLVYGLPIGMPFFWPGATLPSKCVWGYGQNLSRTTYAALFAAYSTTYGVGDGSTTFGMPDYRGRVIAGKDDMGGSSANRLTGLSGGLDGDVLGAVGGLETHTLLLAQIAAHAHANTVGSESVDHSHNIFIYGGRRGANGNAGLAGQLWGSSGDSADFGSFSYATGGRSAGHIHTVTDDSQGGGGAHNNVQPTIINNIAIYAGV